MKLIFLGEFDSSLKQFEYALSIFTKIHGENHLNCAQVIILRFIEKKTIFSLLFDMIKVLLNMGSVYQSSNQFEKALHAFQRSLDIRTKFLPKKNEGIIQLMNAIVSLKSILKVCLFRVILTFKLSVFLK